MMLIIQAIDAELNKLNNYHNLNWISSFYSSKLFEKRQNLRGM